MGIESVHVEKCGKEIIYTTKEGISDSILVKEIYEEFNNDGTVSCLIIKFFYGKLAIFRNCSYVFYC